MPELPFIPYGRQCLDEADIQAVVETLRSDWLTTGPRVGAFEAAVAQYTGAAHAVAVSSGTAALHAAVFSLGIGPGDEVVVPTMTFAATANAVAYQGGTPVFADVLPESLLLDPDSVVARLTPRTKAIIAVDFAGQPCDYDQLRQLADHAGLALVADASHSLGGSLRDRRVGSLADITILSFHPVKPVTTAEGGMDLTADPNLAERMRRFRNHGIDADHRAREERGSWYYEMTDLGYNYRLSDMQCALGLSQLRKLDRFLARRRDIAAFYAERLADVAGVTPLAVLPHREHAWHLYVVRLGEGLNRAEFFSGLRQRGIGANVHYLPVHLHPFYRRRFATAAGLCPMAEAAYEQILSLPLHPAMRDADVNRVVEAVRELAQA
jgi:perosamine synthetase